jgi:N6-adenosine-specific RNA methylase IME4
MSALDAQRLRVREQRRAAAVTKMNHLLKRLDSLRAKIAQAHQAQQFAAMGQLLFEQRALESELQLVIPDAHMESLRSEAARLFGLPTVQSASGAPSVLRPSLIYCDPPWAYVTKVHAMGTHDLYDSMSDSELARLPVAGLGAEDSALLMWATLPKLSAAFRIMEAWGYSYRATFLVWHKVARFYGRSPKSKSIYTRPNAEVLLLGIRGYMPPLTAAGGSVHSNILETRTEEHSRKPSVVRKIIVDTFGDLPRIELFARESTPDWLVWGNEIADSVVTETEVASNVARLRKKKNRQTGDSIKRTLVRSRALSKTGMTRAPSGSALPSSVDALERYEQWNEFARDEVVYVGAPDAPETLEHESKRRRLQALMEHPLVDSLPREPLSAYLSSWDVFHTNTLVPAAQPVNPVYPRLTGAQFSGALEQIKQIQVANSDKVFSLNNPEL